MTYGQVFADTYFYVALLNRKESGHQEAVWASENCRKIFTTEYVLLEVGNSFRGGLGRTHFPGLVEHVYTDLHTTVIPGSTQLLRTALQLFARYEDKEWSLTDCSSFIVMRDLGLREALTADHHFAQAGFVPLMGQHG